MELIQDYIDKGIWLSCMTDQAAWGLIDIFAELGDAIRGVEIGVNCGLNSAMLLDACPNIAKITGIDPYISYVDWNKQRYSQETMDKIHQFFLQNLPLMRDRFELIKMRSEDAKDLFPDESLDFVFIDGDHSARAVLGDIIGYTPKVRPGGVIAGHDIGLPGVNLALRSWYRHQGWDLRSLKLLENQAWYWIKD